MENSNKLKFVVSKKDFEDYLDEVLCRMLPDEPYSKLKYPIDYAEWNRDYHLVLDLIWERFSQAKWFHEYQDEVRRLVGMTTLATRFIAKVVKEQEEKKKTRSKNEIQNTFLLPE